MTKHIKSYLIAWTRNVSYLNLKYQKSVTISCDWSIGALVTDRAWCERRISYIVGRITSRIQNVHSHQTITAVQRLNVVIFWVLSSVVQNRYLYILRRKTHESAGAFAQPTPQYLSLTKTLVQIRKVRTS